jgi:VCBS repeat-containing protein
MATTVIATITAITGTAYARNEDGEVRQLAVGDQLMENEVVITPDGTSVDLAMVDGSEVLIADQAETLLTPDLMPDTAAETADAAVELDSVDAILQALDGDGDLELEATAAGLGGGGEGQGHSFVVLGKVVETVNAQNSESRGVEALADDSTQAEDDLVLLNDVEAVAQGDEEVFSEDAVEAAGGLITGTINVIANDVATADIDAVTVVAETVNVVGPTGDVVGAISFTPEGNYTVALNDLGQAAVNALPEGESLSIAGDYQLVDGTGTITTASVTVVVEGNNDAAVVSSATQVLTETDAALSTGGTLTSADVDNDNTFRANTVAGANGEFAIDANGAWTFAANSTFDSLNVGDSVTETFPVTSIDGTASSVTVTINGTNDAAVISSEQTSMASEDGVLIARGQVTSSDVDNADNTFNASTVTVDNGTFSMDAGGVWSFVASSAVDALNVGESIVETFNVTSVDGTASTVNVTITGTNDAAVVSSETQVLTETDGALSTGGTLTSTDVDNDNNSFTQP